MDIEILPGPYQGNIKIPASKSACQRALLAAALCKGTSCISNSGKSDDEQNMLQSIQKIGAKLRFDTSGSLLITGFGPPLQKQELNVGESGLACRLLTAVCATFPLTTILTGEGSLRNRSMHFFDEILPRFQVGIHSNQGFLPLEVSGPMQGNKLTVDGSMSSQFLSGLLMALPLATGDSVLTVKNLNSKPYIEMTLECLEKFGIQVENRNFETFAIPGNQEYLATNIEVEGDWSSASYWLVASALGNDISVDALSRTSLQADRMILQAFENANCKVLSTSGGLTISGTDRKAFEFDATHCPDLFPALAVFAALTPGTSKIKGIHRLIHKESNRATAIQEEFNKLGIPLSLEGDLMLISGQESITGGTVFSHNDHRIAMSLAILGMFTTSPLLISHAESVSKSYPDFWVHLEKLNA